MNNSQKSNQILPSVKNILIIGNGGRENSLAWGLRKSEGVEKVYVCPGNGGTEDLDDCFSLDIKSTDVENILLACTSYEIDLVVIGPEAPLAEGLADKLRQKDLTVFGPGQEGAQLEASKDWAKKLMTQSGIPTAKYWTVQSKKEALSILNQLKKPLVVKVDGLAAGKGVTVSKTIEETILAIDEAFKGKFGEAGNTIVLEEILSGPEVSIFALCDGERMVLLPPAQDHKRLREGDKGPNTGGMGAYAPAPLINSAQLESIRQIILEPTLEALKNRKIDYRGVIYAGLMLTSSGPQVIEFNCRFGDPECQTLIPLLGNELAEVLQACALGKLNECSELSIKDNCSVCIVAAAEGYPESPRKGDLITISLESTPSVQIFHSGTQRNSNGQLITSGGRVISLVAQGETFDKAFTKAYTAMEKIKFSGINFRSDIGHQVRKSFLLS
tara:strand:+ start:16339 stop:17667 length:1329 start_codon:yes stop_codon:yes gene_type:complete